MLVVYLVTGYDPVAFQPHNICQTSTTVYEFQVSFLDIYSHIELIIAQIELPREVTVCTAKTKLNRNRSVV